MTIVASLEHSMSSRARGFLMVATGHFLLLGVTMLFWPPMYRAPSWLSLSRYTELAPWGWAHLIVGLICLVAVVTKWPSYARAGMVLAFIVLITTGFAVGWGVIGTWFDWHQGLTDSPASPFVPVACLALGIKDMLMVSAPLRTPFQDASVPEPQTTT